jgi:Mn-dependent DtxR family transcriptional regulator
LRYLLELLDGDVGAIYHKSGLTTYRPRYTPVVRALLELGPASITAIAAHAGVTHSAVSQTVAEMRRRKLVTMARGKDARERQIKVAAGCERLLPVLKAHWQATNRAARLLDRELSVPLAGVVEEAIAALERQPFFDRIREHLPAADSKPLESSAVATERRKQLRKELPG